MFFCFHVTSDESSAGNDRCCCAGFVLFSKSIKFFPSASRKAGSSLNRPSTRVCRMGPHRVMGNGVINNRDLPYDAQMFVSESHEGRRKTGYNLIQGMGQEGTSDDNMFMLS